MRRLLLWNQSVKPSTNVLLLTLSARSPRAKDKTENTGRMFVAKNRNGPDGMVYPMNMDTSKVCLEVLPVEEGGTIDSVVAKTKEEQQNG